MARVLWTQRQDVGPSPRGGHALAYDATRGRVVLFGGRAAGERLQGDTWEWDGHDWTQVADTGPDARAGHALAFDAARERIMLCGGEAAGPTLRADTWAWDGEDWTQVADTGPDARVGHALAFDAPRGRVVLFGGESAGPTLQGDSWEWDGGAEWTQVADTGPAARRDHGMAFDVAHGRVVLFGGAVASGDANDTWAWDGSEWTQVADMGPLPSRAVGMTFAGAATLLFGGISSAPALATEQLSRLSWEWDGEHWTLRQDMGPTPRWGHALAFDSQRGRPVLFGGVSVLPGDANVASSVLGDTWEAKLEEVAPPAGSPTLVSFTLNPDTIDGAGGGTISLEVVIDRPAPPGGASVSILMQGQELLADPILVGEGQATGTVFIELSGGPSNFLPPGDHTLEARLNGSSVTAVLHIL